MISLKNITKSFKLGDNDIEILHGINLEIKKGRVYSYHRSVWLWQINPDEHPWLLRQPKWWAVPA